MYTMGWIIFLGIGGSIFDFDNFCYYFTNKVRKQNEKPNALPYLEFCR